MRQAAPEAWVACVAFGAFVASPSCAPYEPPPDVARAEAKALRGVDTSGLGAGEARFHALLASEPCPCAEAHALGECLRRDHCRFARPAARLVARRLRAGENDGEVKHALRRRFGARRPVEFDLAAAPALGDPRAPIVLVEFSDFECPFCREFAPLLGQAVAKSGGRARLHFKHFPLARHAHAEEAARAAEAARRQGKFWEMHDALFADQAHLGRADLERRAAALGLDAARFARDLDDPAVAARVAADRADGEAGGRGAQPCAGDGECAPLSCRAGTCGVNGTPALFVNGRPFDGDRTLDAVLAWIRDERE